MGVVIVIVVVVLFLGLIALAFWAEQRRRRLVGAAAAEHGFTELSQAELDGLYRRFDFEPFTLGDTSEFDFGVQGTWDTRPALLCDFRYTIKGSRPGESSKRVSTTHRFAVTAIRLPTALPSLDVRPEGVISRAWGALMNTDLDFESEDFNRAFIVESPDRAYATAVLHPRMMEHLLSLDDVAFRIEGRDALILTPGKHLPSDLTHPLETLDGIIDLIPAQVLEGGQR